jgi:hypothetical protein
MPEDAPKKTYKAKVTVGGLLPPDHPMFTEGWRFALPLKSLRSMASSLGYTDGINPEDQVNEAQGKEEDQEAQEDLEP